MANVIQFDQGIQEYSLNNAVTVYFNPTDGDFINRVYDAMVELDRKNTAYLEAVNGSTTNEQVFTMARARDAELREIINGIFGDDVCTPLFGKMNLFALADGLPVWANLILAIIDTFYGEFAEEKKKTNPRLAKYTEKYSKRAV